MPEFLKLRLTTEAIIIGERVKAGTFRPCLETIPTSTIMGSLKEHFGLDAAAIGFFKKETYQKRIFIYAPHDTCLKTAKLPISAEYLCPKESGKEVEAEVYIEATDEAKEIFKDNSQVWEITMGALRSKGFGLCGLKFDGNKVNPVRCIGKLRGRFRINEAQIFGIDSNKDVMRPIYGYLFRPDKDPIMGKFKGQYEKALIEGTILEGPDFLMEFLTERGEFWQPCLDYYCPQLENS